MNFKAKRPSCFLAMLAMCVCACLQAQDTLRLTLPQAERLFVEKNLSLLAQRYSIDIAKAQVIQARLYNNPNLQFTGNIYNPDRKKALDISNRTGEYLVEAQQLVLLAGKRSKQVRLAESAIVLEESRFFDLLRTLNYSIRSDFYQLYYLQNSISAYTLQIGQLERLDNSYQELLAKGIVTLKDAVRIKSLLYSLRAEGAALQNQATDLNAELQLLVQNNSAVIIPVVEDGAIPVGLAAFPLPLLLDSAFSNRADLKLAQNTVTFTQRDLTLQKALATPDLVVGAQFDKRGSFVDNASFFTVAMDLPFFNRNQGNIKAAKIRIDQAQTLLSAQQQAVINEVQRAYTKALNTEKMLRSFDPEFRQQLERLLQGITENFQKKNIGLLELTDFYESYKQTILQMNQLQNDRMQAIEALQFAVGKNLIN